MGQTFEQSTRRRVIATVVSTASIIFLTGGTCTTTKPDSDATAPKLTWIVLDRETNDSTELAKDATFQATRGRDYRVTLRVEDPEGVHRIKLGTSSQWQCRSGDVAQNKGPSLDAPLEDTYSPDASNKVLTVSALFREVSMEFSCQSGFTLASGSVSLTGVGENYYSGVTNGALKVAV